MFLVILVKFMAMVMNKINRLTMNKLSKYVLVQFTVMKYSNQMIMIYRLFLDELLSNMDINQRTRVENLVSYFSLRTNKTFLWTE